MIENESQVIILKYQRYFSKMLLWNILFYFILKKCDTNSGVSGFCTAKEIMQNDSAPHIPDNYDRASIRKRKKECNDSQEIL